MRPTSLTRQGLTEKPRQKTKPFARLQIAYSGINYERLFRLSPDEFLLSLHRYEGELKGKLAKTSSGALLDARFLRFEGARIEYFGALLRVMRLGLSGDWKEYASHLDFNDPALLPIDTYSRFLSRYTKAKAFERAFSDPVLKTSINQVTEARYAVAVETYKDPVVRSAQLHEILLNQFAEGDDGPFVCKGIESLMARFDRDCTDAPQRADIDERCRDCLANRNAPVRISSPSRVPGRGQRIPPTSSSTGPAGRQACRSGDTAIVAALRPKVS